MIVDDSEIDNFINSKMIEGCGFASQVYVHSSGVSALEFLKNINKTANSSSELIPEIIFLDLNMPVMDGFQFVAEFEKLPIMFRRHIKIIMFTTSVNPDDREKALQQKSICDFINKPMSQIALEKLHPAKMLKKYNKLV